MDLRKIGINKAALISCIDAQTIEDRRFLNVDKDTLLKYLEQSNVYYPLLIFMSRFMYVYSTAYKRAIEYKANMLTFDYFIRKHGDYRIIDRTVKNKNTFEENTYNCYDFVDKMKLKQLGSKINTFVLRDGIFYGYVHKTEDSFDIIRLPIEICQHDTSYDNVYNLTIDLAKINENIATILPSEIHEEYLNYRQNNGEQYYMLGHDVGIVIKADSGTHYPVPDLIGMIPDILDTIDYKKLKKENAKSDTIKIIALKIPIDDKDINALLTDSDVVDAYVEIAEYATDGTTAIFPTALDPIPIQFPKSVADNDNVDDSTRYVYDNAGINQLLFNGKNNTALTYSVIRDSTSLFNIYGCWELWINRVFMFNNQFNLSFVKFEVDFFRMTYYNKKDYIETELKICTLSYPNKERLGCLMGYTLQSLLLQDYFENTLIKLGSNFMPLVSSYNESSDNTGGKPPKDAKDITDKGEETRETDGNDR